MSTFYLLSGNQGGEPLRPGPARFAFAGASTCKQAKTMMRVARGQWAFLTYARGLVLPHEIISGDLGSLRTVTFAARRTWAEWVYPSLVTRLKGCGGVTEVVFFCSRHYHAEMAPWLVRDLGVKVSCPFDGLPSKEQQDRFSVMVQEAKL